MDTPVRSVLGEVQAVRVGRVRTHMWGGREVVSAAVKEPVTGPVRLGSLGLSGDEQADRRVHGGRDKAVLVYAAAHYRRWVADGLDIPAGGFFENLTIAGPDGDMRGPDETTVVLGETWRVGSALVQVSQPRSPCYKLARRWGVRDLVLTVQRTGRTGWYLRVLEEGEVSTGDSIALVDRPAEAPTLAEVTRVMTVDKDDLDAAARLADVPGLPERWRATLRDRLAGVVADESARIYGPA